MSRRFLETATTVVFFDDFTSGSIDPSRWKHAVTTFGGGVRGKSLYQNTTQHSTAQHSTAQHSTAPYSTAQHNKTQHSTAKHSTAQQNTTQHSTAKNSTAQHHTAQQNTAQHSTAQHNTTHNTARHSTTCHNAARPKEHPSKHAGSDSEAFWLRPACNQNWAGSYFD